MPKQTVVLYGNSLIVSSIGASLQGCPGLQVLPVDPANPDTNQHLLSFQPDIILFDLAAIQPDSLVALWKEQPRLLLIGVDQAKGSALVLSSQPARLVTTDDLLQVIAGQTGDEPGPHDKPGSARIAE
jgi:hypothetical protein